MHDRELKNQTGNGTTRPGADQATKASDSDQGRLGKIAHGPGPDDYLAHMQGLGGPVSHSQAARGVAPAHAAQETNGPAPRSMGAYEYATGKASPGGTTTNTSAGQMSAYEYATSEASRDGAAASDRGIAVPNVVQDAQLGPDWTAHRFVFMAADRATKSLPRVRSGDQMPAAALTALAQPIAAATEALKRVWLAHRAPMMGDEKQIQAWAKTEYELDRLLAVVLQLQMMASATPRDRGLGSAAPSAAALASNVLELEAAAALLGYRPPGTLADAQARVAVACPPGSEKTDNPHCEVDQTTRQGRIDGIEPQLAVLLSVFFDACTQQESTLEAMIEHDAKWAEIVVGVFALVHSLPLEPVRWRQVRRQQVPRQAFRRGQKSWATRFAKPPRARSASWPTEAGTQPRETLEAERSMRWRRLRWS